MNNFFMNMCDELVQFSENDVELAEGLRWVDMEAQKRGISFYDMIAYVLYAYDVKQKAKDWMRDKN